MGKNIGDSKEPGARVPHCVSIYKLAARTMQIFSFKKGRRCSVPREQEYVGINRKKEGYLALNGWKQSFVGATTTFGQSHICGRHGRAGCYFFGKKC